MRCSAALDGKATKVFHQMFDPRLGEQIIAHAHIRADEIVYPQQVREPCRIHNDVAMVGHEESPMLDVFLYLLAVAEVVQFQALRPFPRPNLQEREDDQKVRQP